MTSPNTRSALAALDTARPLIVRLDERRHPEDAAADLIEGWAAVETALRAMVGGSSLGGQALVSDVRAQGLLDYPHAHALLGFLAARDRATRPDYHPSGEDVAAARAGFQAIEAANGVGIAADTDTHPTPAGPPPPPPPPAPRAPRATQEPRDGVPPAAPYSRDARDARGSSAAPPAPPPLPDAYDRAERPRRSPVLLAGLALLVVLGSLGAYFLLARPRRSGAIEQAVAAYEAGRFEDARRGFEAAAAQEPTLARPHVYLARLARRDGDVPRATAELTTALRLERTNAVALREMGMLQLQANQPQLAGRFLARAIASDASDSVAMGWMGCALTRQGNAALAANFYARAGQGEWTACQQSAPAGAGPAGVAAPGLPPGAPLGAPPGASGSRAPLGP
jgi:tetratricopeptide (TPR) repeat protein